MYLPFPASMQTNLIARLLVGMVLTCVFAFTANADSETKKNVLLICVDDLKPVLGCYGDSFAKTPHIDRLASRGVTFDAAYCNQAVCSPSRNALLTSLRPQTLGVYDLPTHFRKAAPDAITLGQYFRSHGYHTQSLGKIFHVGHGNIDDSASWDVPFYRPKAGTYAVMDETKQRVDKTGKVKGMVTESADVPDDFYFDGAVAKEAIARLQTAAANPNQPFVLAVGFIRPHLPFVAPQKYWDLYDPSQVPMPKFGDKPEFAPEYAPTSFGELRSYAGVPEKGEIDDALTRHLIHGYYAATSYTDAQIGRLLDALDASDAANNTIVVLWGDHGWHLGDHGMWCKHTNYEQAARIPVIVSAPGAAKNAHTPAMIESVDVYPTLAELAGLERPTGLDGQSFAKVVQSPKVAGRSSVIHVYPRGNRLGRAIRTERYRLVEWKPWDSSADEVEYELYDYESDTLETKNLAAIKPDVVQELKAILATHPEPKPQWSERTPTKKETTKKKATKKKATKATGNS